MNEAHEHCWHTEGEWKAILGGGDVRHVCCHCGLVRALPSLRAPVEGHGPYIAGDVVYAPLPDSHGP